MRGEWSVDLGSSTMTEITIVANGLRFGSPDESDHTDLRPQVTFDELKKMSKAKRVGAWECFKDGETAPDKIAGISEETDRTASLQPHVHGAPPTVVLGGFGMHRFKDTDPWKDTEAKVRALGGTTCGGRVLDVCTGLGYTAIALARLPHVAGVTTVELDPLVVDIQKRNPWSEELFRSAKIERVVQNAVDYLPTLPTGEFNAIVHDPPAQAMAGELYSTEFYLQLARVLRPSGRLFHYIGDPKSNESGRLFRGVSQRLKETGFRSVQRADDAYGVVASASLD